MGDLALAARHGRSDSLAHFIEINAADSRGFRGHGPHFKLVQSDYAVDSWGYRLEIDAKRRGAGAGGGRDLESSYWRGRGLRWWNYGRLWRGHFLRNRLSRRRRGRLIRCPNSRKHFADRHACAGHDMCGLQHAILKNLDLDRALLRLHHGDDVATFQRCPLAFEPLDEGSLVHICAERGHAECGHRRTARAHRRNHILQFAGSPQFPDAARKEWELRRCTRALPARPDR